MQYRILTIDDESYVTETLCRKFGQRGWEAISAPNGQAGFEAAVAHLPNLIICDSQMPTLNGIATAEKLYNDERTRHIPIVILTARAHLIEPSEVLGTSIIEVMAKPFSVQQLCSFIEEQIQMASASQDAAIE